MAKRYTFWKVKRKIPINMCVKLSLTHTYFKSLFIAINNIETFEIG